MLMEYNITCNNITGSDWDVGKIESQLNPSSGSCYFETGRMWLYGVVYGIL